MITSDYITREKDDMYLLSDDVRSVDARGFDKLEEIDNVLRVDSVQHGMYTNERSSSPHTITVCTEGDKGGVKTWPRTYLHTTVIGMFPVFLWSLLSSEMRCRSSPGAILPSSGQHNTWYWVTVKDAVF